MDEALKRLLNRLKAIGETHEEIYDSECRELMSRAVFEGFIRRSLQFTLPEEYGLFSAEANREVRDALSEYIDVATRISADLHLNTFHERLIAFQNPCVHSDDGEEFYDDFFGYSNPSSFDSTGGAIGA